MAPDSPIMGPWDHRGAMGPWDHHGAMGPSWSHGTIMEPWDHHGAMEGHRGSCMTQVNFV